VSLPETKKDFNAVLQCNSRSQKIVSLFRYLEIGFIMCKHSEHSEHPEHPAFSCFSFDHLNSGNIFSYKHTKKLILKFDPESKHKNESKNAAYLALNEGD
jgi:hypothetical protein